MHSPALALNWQIWGRHRWGLAAALLTVAGVCALPQAIPRDKLASDIGNTGAPVVLAILLPFSLVILYLAYAFSHAELGSRTAASGFPSWMLTLPVRTPWLVLWPMVSAAVTAAATWLAVSWLSLNQVGLDVPVVWPALGLACTLVWIQALDWSPLGSVSKALLACAVLAGLWTGLIRDATHDATFAALPAVLLLGFAAGAAGVSRLRRGGPGHRLPIVRAPALPWRIGRERKFATAQQAQLWLEWRRNGRLLPLLAACWVLLVALFMVLSNDRNATNMMAATPYLSLMLAPVAGLILGKPDVWSRSVRLPTWAAGRPLTCGDLVLAKLRMTALSLLAAWLVLALGLVIWLAWGRQYADLWQALERLLEMHGSARGYALIAAAVIGFFGFNLHLMAGTLVVSLTGRFWLLLATLFLYLGGLPNLLASDVFRFVQGHLVELASAALLIKLLLAGWAFASCYRRGLLSGTGITGLVATWCLTVGCALLAFYLALPEDTNALTTRAYVRDHALGVGLLCPLFRIGLAPLALAWNRHR